MKNLLALAGVVALMTACAGVSGTADDGANGGVSAAMLGYHGPLQAAANVGYCRGALLSRAAAPLPWR